MGKSQFGIGLNQKTEVLGWIGGGWFVRKAWGREKWE